MFEFMKKKKTGGPNGGPGKEDGDKLDIEVPDADGTIDDLDAALAAADGVKAQKVRDEKEAVEREKLRQRERDSIGSSCGCGGGRW